MIGFAGGTAAGGTDVQNGGEMTVAKKRRKNPTKKYWWKDVYWGTIPEIHAKYKQVVARAAGTNLRLLDGTPDVQETLTGETFANAVWIWIEHLVEKHGIGWLEQEFTPIFAELSKLVASDMKENPRGAGSGGDPGPPEGFSRPSGQTGPGRKPRRPPA